MGSGKRKRAQRKKQAAVVAVTALAAAALAVGLYLNRPDAQDTASVSENSSQTVTYQGKTYRYNDHLSNFLFLGVDTRETLGEQNSSTGGTAGQADAIYLLSWDRAENTLQGISIPRDTMTEIETFDLQGNSLGLTENHLNLQYAYGDGAHTSCRLMEEAVSRLLYQVPIQGYCALNMDAMPVLADSVDGVEITVPDDSLAEVDPSFVQGAQVTITGENAETFLRHRDIEQTQSAIARTQRQKVFLTAFAEKARQKSGEDAGFVTDLYNQLQDYMVTSLDAGQFLDLSQASWQDESMRDLPGEGTQGDYYDEYHVNDDELYAMILDMFYVETEGEDS